MLGADKNNRSSGRNAYKTCFHLPVYLPVEAFLPNDFHFILFGLFPSKAFFLFTLLRDVLWRSVLSVTVC